MRNWIRLLCASLAILAVAGPAAAQVGYDRHGGDYTSFSIRSGDPALCAARCEREPRCRAWSFSYPRTINTLATCWLKSAVPARTEAECCASGVRGAGVIERRGGAVEFGIDRLGGDYRNFELKPDATGESCKAACDGDKRCRAWTYVRPGYIAPVARCYLKSRLTGPKRKPCCISGVVR